MNMVQTPCATVILTSSGPSKFQVIQCKARTWTWIRGS